MRIPFDLIAAILFLEGVGRCPAGRFLATPLSSVFVAWGGFLLVSWLLHELAARDAEWRTRFGMRPSGLGSARHPLIIHTWAVRVAQVCGVLLYAGLLWSCQWPQWVERWPVAVGLRPDSHIGQLVLAKSSVVAIPLNLLPFLLGMVASWIPRRRLAARMRGRAIPLTSYLSFEARLTWLPLVIGIILAALSDMAEMLPAQYTAWLKRPGIDLLAVLAFIALTSLVFLPRLIIWLWRCKPLPEGDLKERLLALMRRSNVRAREIMVWGPRGSGLLNACVLGGWARFRYVLISPALVDELGTEQTEAVLAHELGHARYGHLAFLFVMVLCLSALLNPALDLLPQNWRDSPLVEIGALMCLIGAYMYFFYGTIMRQCEREADLASAELLGTSAPLVAALERLAQMTGNVRNVWCWHHGSIAERVSAVEQLSRDPEAGRRLHASLRRMRILFTLLTAAALVAELWTRLI